MRAEKSGFPARFLVFRHLSLLSINRWRAIALSAALLIGHLPAAFAYDPLEFAPEHIPAARLNGSSVVRRYGKPVYIVKLFVAPDRFQQQNLSAHDLKQTPFAIDIEYLKPCTGADISRNFRSEMADMGLAPTAKINSWTVDLRRFTPDLAKHDHLTVVFQPGQPTTFYRNGDVLGPIAGADFARAFSGIWLDEASTVPGARATLLHATH